MPETPTTMSARSLSAQIAATANTCSRRMSLPQHEEVLRADRDDEREAEAEAGESGRERHAFDARRHPSRSIQLKILQRH